MLTDGLNERIASTPRPEVFLKKLHQFDVDQKVQFCEMGTMFEGTHSRQQIIGRLEGS